MNRGRCGAILVHPITGSPDHPIAEQGLNEYHFVCRGETVNINGGNVLCG